DEAFSSKQGKFMLDKNGEWILQGEESKLDLLSFGSLRIEQSENSQLKFKTSFSGMASNLREKLEKLAKEKWDQQKYGSELGPFSAEIEGELSKSGQLESVEVI